MTTGYIIEHEGKQYSPDGGVSVESIEQHNAKLETAELAYWAQKPDRMVAYINITNSECTTWRGTSLGRIIETSRFRNNLTGSRMEHVRIIGNNGATYYGTYGCDWSQAVRLRRAKA